MLVCIVMWFGLLLGFGHVWTLAVAIPVLILIGMAQSIAMISMSVSLLSAAGERFRGRVMGVRTLAVYGLPLGLMASGALIDRMGFPATVTLYCTVGLPFTCFIGLRRRAHLSRA